MRGNVVRADDFYRAVDSFVGFEAHTLQPVLCAPEPELDVWLIDLDAHAAIAEASVLSAAEHDRAAHFLFASDARRFIACRHALRTLLARHTRRAARDVTLSTGPHGKPLLADNAHLHFSVSHSGGFGLIAISRSGAVGIDLEVVEPSEDIRLLARTIFTPAEQVVLAGLDAKGFAHAALLGWTRKEACLKAIGCGFTLDPRSFEVHMEQLAPDVSILWQARQWRLRLHALPLPQGLIASVCCADVEAIHAR